jgi:hypothetical protein
MSSKTLRFIMHSPSCTARAEPANQSGLGACFATLTRCALLCAIWLPIGSCTKDEPDAVLTCADFAGETQRPSIPLTYSTEHLDIHVEDGVMMCAGSAEDWEHFYQYVAHELDITPTQRVPVYLMRVPGKKYCGREHRIGCVKHDGVVFTTYQAVYHELVHGLACEWRHNSTPFLVEGLAQGFIQLPLSFSAPPAEFVTHGREGFSAYYGNAAHFVRWLLATEGPDSLRRAYQRAPIGGGPGVLAVLDSVYGDVDALFEDYEQNAPDEWAPHRLCDGIPVLEPMADQTWHFESTFDCSDRSTRGPWTWTTIYHYDAYAAREMYQSFLIEIDTPLEYRFQRVTEPGDYTGLVVWRCLDDLALSKQDAKERWFQSFMFSDSDGGTEVELEPGVYRVDVVRDHAPPHVVTVDVFPADQHEW